MTDMSDKEHLLMRNLGYYLSASTGLQFSEKDQEYLVSLNMEVIQHLEELLGPRFQAVGLPSALINEGNAVNAYCVRVENIVTHAGHSDRAENIAVRIAEPCLEDKSLTLFMHSPALPGGVKESMPTQLDRTKWRSRYFIKPGTLFINQATETAPLPVPYNGSTRPPGFGLDFNQVMEGTSPVED
jgi:hypothetical protein